MSDKEQKKMIIIEQRFAIIQIEGIGTCGGTLEQNNKAILSAIDNIYGIFRRWDSFFLTYDPIPYLLRQVEEQIEEEGAYEEIEANMFHLKVQEALGLNWSSSLKKSICNSKKDSSNGRDW
ncbi:MAG: hypothetical protein EZS28_015910 [Streblomastix strix]|uniref:Uncharacterized protein n=1 Tax=Streblomastix strix TaxID=222440 RepID=A0A5J4W190_9EUKA|nr:MAG: hypothetical protein EZS28_015910 [Streblomastix strix]